jgi:hypothetical protein
MIAKATREKPKCVLLDANVIIEAYKLGVWNNLLQCTEIIVPSIVARQEALFFKKNEGRVPKPIQLKRLIRKGLISEMVATSAEMVSLQEVFDSVFIHTLHDGELEALALILADRVGDALFCTSDASPICALAMIGASDLGISMEELLQIKRLQKPLEWQFSEKFFQIHVTAGKENRITGRGLRGGKGIV